MTIDSKTRTRIRSALRKISQWSEAVRNTRTKARVKRGLYKCESCGKFCKKVDVDHIEAVGPTPGSRVAPEGYTWDEFINRLFCGEDNLQALCKQCHKSKTKKGRGDGKKKAKPASRTKGSSSKGKD